MTQRLAPSFYIGREFTFSTARHAVETFFYLQVHMRAMLDYRYKIYADSFFLRSTDQSRALLSLDEVRTDLRLILERIAISIGTTLSRRAARAVYLCSVLWRADAGAFPPR